MLRQTLDITLLECSLNTRKLKKNTHFSYVTQNPFRILKKKPKNLFLKDEIYKSICSTACFSVNGVRVCSQWRIKKFKVLKTPFEEILLLNVPYINLLQKQCQGLTYT